LLILAETEAEIADDTRIEAQELEMIIQEQYNAIQGTSLHIIMELKTDDTIFFFCCRKSCLL